MKTSLERLPKSRVRLSVQVPQSVVQQAVDAAFHKLGEQVEIKGFRKGQAPKRLIFEAVGLSRLREEVLEELLPTTYFEAVQKEKVVPVEGPQVKIESADWEAGLSEGRAVADVRYVAEVDVLPEVTLTEDYKKLRIADPAAKLAEPDVTDAEVETVIDQLRRQQAELKDVERPAKEGDRVEIDFEGTIDHVKRPEFSSQNYPLILGSSTLLPEFEKELIGMKRGENKSFSLPIPKKDDPRHQETVHFTVTMRMVQEMLLPPVTDEFARKVGQESVLALRGAVRTSLKQSKKERQRRALEQEIAEQLLSAANIEVPESLVHQEIHRMIEALKTQATQYNLPWEVYLAQLKKTEADLHRDLRAQAEKTVKFGLILGYIMNKEGIDRQDPEAGRKTMQRLVEYATG